MSMSSEGDVSTQNGGTIEFFQKMVDVPGNPCFFFLHFKGPKFLDIPNHNHPLKIIHLEKPPSPHLHCHTQDTYFAINAALCRHRNSIQEFCIKVLQPRKSSWQVGPQLFQKKKRVHCTCLCSDTWKRLICAANVVLVELWRTLLEVLESGRLIKVDMWDMETAYLPPTKIS